MLTQVRHQVNDPPQGMTLMINNPMAQEVTKMPYGLIMVQRFFHPLCTLP